MKGTEMNVSVEQLSDGDRVRLHPNSDNPIHKQPVYATYSQGYFFCDGSGPADGPDYFFRDVLTFNDRIELIVTNR